MKTKKAEAVSEMHKRECLALQKRDGTLTANSVVAAASDPAHPLHDHFEWDDTVAGHKWRLEQARELIASVRVEITYRDLTVSGVVYVRSPRVATDEQGYLNVKAMTEEEKRAAMSREVEQLEATLSRVERVAISLGFYEELAALRRKVSKVRATLAPRPAGN